MSLLRKNDLKIIKLLLEKGLLVNSRNDLSIALAIYNLNLDALKILIEYYLKQGNLITAEKLSKNKSKLYGSWMRLWSEVDSNKNKVTDSKQEIVDYLLSLTNFNTEETETQYEPPKKKRKIIQSIKGFFNRN
jgi:hypothetical protein